jgi:SH3-like domain-containing protein
MKALRFFLIALMFGAYSGPSIAMPEGTGLPLPRFASLRADEVNLRTGPGVQYPVDWVYHRKSMPVEIIAEYRTWRKIRDWQGTQGWMHRSMLDGKRTVIITGTTRSLRAKENAKSAPLARAEPSVLGTLLKCPDKSGWCKVNIDGFQGWLRRVDFWGVHRRESLE